MYEELVTQLMAADKSFENVKVDKQNIGLNDRTKENSDSREGFECVIQNWMDPKELSRRTSSDVVSLEKLERINEELRAFYRNGTREPTLVQLMQQIQYMGELLELADLDENCHSRSILISSTAVVERMKNALDGFRRACEFDGLKLPMAERIRYYLAYSEVKEQSQDK